MPIIASRPAACTSRDAHVAAERDQMGADQAVGGEAADEEGGEQVARSSRCRRRGAACRSAAPGRIAGGAGGRRPSSAVGAIAHQADRRPGAPAPAAQTSGRRQRSATARSAPPASSRPLAPATRAAAGRPAGRWRVLAVSRPITRPRLVLNQRLTMVAPSTLATAPEPMPESTPQVTNRCHGSVISRLSAVEPDISRERAKQRAAHADALHQRGGERAGQAIEEDADAGGQRDDVAAPAEASFPAAASCTRGADRRPAAISRQRKIDADHDESVALAERAGSGLSCY